MDALLLSLRLATCVSLILLLFGMPLAYWLAYWNWRGKFLLEDIVALPLQVPPTVPGFYVLHGHRADWCLRGKLLLEALVALPLVLPPTVLGFYVLIALGPHGPIGKVSEALFHRGLAFTFGGLVFASVLYSFLFTIQPLIASFEAIDRRLLDASALLGASRLRTFGTVILP